MFTALLRVTAFTLAITVLTGIAYPLAVTALAGTFFPHQANGSLIKSGDTVIGSELIAQNFTGPGYFQPRPSAAGAGYEANNSGASNLGVTSKALNETFAQRVAAQIAANGAGKIPADMITASGSGLDPDITPDAALYQAQRIAHARNLKTKEIQMLVTRMTKGRTFGFLGMPRVNVLAINLELDKMGGDGRQK